MFEDFSGSPWVGLDNFRVLLALEQHLFALVNTLSINVILLLLISSYPLILCYWFVPF